MASVAPTLEEFLHDALAENPHDYYDELRRTTPAFRSPMGLWLITSYELFNAVLRDTKLWSNNPTKFATVPDPYLSDPSGGPFSRWYSEILLFKDGMDHKRMRRLVSRAFTRKAIGQYGDGVRAAVDDQLDELGDSREFDFVHDFALPMPTRVILDLFGIDQGEQDRFYELTELILPPADRGTPEEWFAHADAVYEKHVQFFHEIARDRRQNPREDIVSLIVASDEEGDALGDVEVMAMVTFLVTAGYETTANTFANGVYLLLDRGLMGDLQGDRSLIPGAVEEILRYEGAARSTAPRVATEDTVLGGMEIVKGEMLMASAQAANRDPAAFEDPHRFDIHREPNRHVGFGVGPHVCLGAPLARLELQVGIERILDRMPDLQLNGDVTFRTDTFLMRGLSSLPVRW